MVFFTPTQAILEYPIAFGLLGLAGISSISKELDSFKDYFNIALSVLLAIGGRFICHLLAGVIFFLVNMLGHKTHGFIH